MRATKELTVKCSNEYCPVINFHPSCLKIENSKFTNSWICPLCQNVFSKKVLSAEVCVCKKRVSKANTKSLLKCTNDNCSNGSYFHLECLGLKKRPNHYKTKWLCYMCQAPTSKKKASVNSQSEQIINFPHNNGCDCSIFSIAFATSLAFGIHPENVHFNEKLLRSHLKKCLQSGHIESFPVIN